MAVPSGVIWITGASSGLGRALTMLYVGEGWVVAGSANDPAGLEDVATQCNSLSGRFVSLPLDVRDAEAVARTVDTIETDIGPIDTAILAAGIYRTVTGDDPDPGVIRSVAEVNLFGTIECLNAVLGPMKSRNSGRIAVIASLSGYIGLPYFAAYGMTKAALINFAQCLYPDLARLGIKLHLVTPGFIATPMTATDQLQMPHKMSAEEAAQRIRSGLAKDNFEISFPRLLSWAVRILRVLPLRWAQAVNGSARQYDSITPKSTSKIPDNP